MLHFVGHLYTPYPGVKLNIGELWDINYWGPIVDISKFISMCDKSRHTGLGLESEPTD